MGAWKWDWQLKTTTRLLMLSLLMLVMKPRMPQIHVSELNHCTSQARGTLQTRVLAMWTRNKETQGLRYGLTGCVRIFFLNLCVVSCAIFVSAFCNCWYLWCFLNLCEQCNFSFLKWIKFLMSHVLLFHNKCSGFPIPILVHWTFGLMSQNEGQINYGKASHSRTKVPRPGLEPTLC